MVGNGQRLSMVDQKMLGRVFDEKLIEALNVT